MSVPQFLLTKMAHAARVATMPAGLLLIAWPALPQTINSFAGNGSAGFSGDGAPAIAAALNHPKGIAIDFAGNLYIADPDNARIRFVGVNGIISTFAGNGTPGESGDGGPALAASFSDVMSVALDASGNLYVADSSNRRIRKISNGVVTSIAGTGVEGFSGDGGPAANAMLGRPVGLVVDYGGNIICVDSTAHRIRKIDSSGIISTIAGNGVNGFSGDGGPATLASLSFPLAVAIDRASNLYVADAGNNRIRMIAPNGVITTIAGNGGGGFAGDGGMAVNASLNIPSDMAVDSAGNLYIADSGNNRIRRVNAAGIITTLAGINGNGFSGDGGPPAQAMLNFPWGVALDLSGGVYIADRVNNRIRKISGATTNPNSPSIDSAINGASFSSGVPIAPGSIVSLFGTNLADATVSAPATPLPTALGETAVTFNGISAPLYFVSAGQINLQVPFVLPTGTATIQVYRGGMAGVARTVNVGLYSPGIFLLDSAGTGAIFHGDFSVVTATAPARAGETVVIYATGLGPVSAAAISGVPAALNRTTTVPSVSIGGVNVNNVAYSGLAPGLVGVYQLNVAIPSGLTPGNKPVQIAVGGLSSNTTMIAVAP